MLLSLRWLQRYVELGDLEASRIADDLTMATAEVDDVLVAGDGLSDIVVGHVAECGRHPDADKLSLTKIDDGSGELLQVVCGAPNVAQGQRIAFCRVGTRVPVDNKKLKKGKIRGQASLGMICSERELGLSEAHDGILVLDTEAAPGTSLADVLPVRDTLIEIDNKSITHRPDLWGHYGFARELAAIYGRELGAVLEGRAVDIPSEGETVPIDLEPSDGLCSRYAGLVIDGVSIRPSPEWMRYLLIAVGQRPIDNVVDLSNFLLLDIGQPTHAFDLARLAGPRIEVRRAGDGETMKTLDGFERKLTPSDLLICDGDGPVALAGVMGGEGSMVTGDTQRVLLESANFDAATIRRTSTRLGLRSDSSARFEKSLDPLMAETAVHKFVSLLPEVVPGAKAAGPIHDPSAWSFEGRSVHLRLERASKLLGVEIDEPTARGYLEPLGFELKEAGFGAFDVAVPSWRATKDVAIEEDLVEELGRRHRYDEITPVSPLAPVEATYVDPELELQRRVRECLAHDCGLFEAYNYSFLPDDLCARLELGDLQYVQVTNAIAEHMSRVRRDVLPSLLGSLTENVRHSESVAIFEVGKGYRPDEPGEVRSSPAQNGEGSVEKRLPREVLQAVAARVERGKGASHPYARLRGDLEQLLLRLAHWPLASRRMRDDEATQWPWMHPGRTAVFCASDDEAAAIAYVGELHPKIAPALDLELGPDGGAAAFTLDLRALLAREAAELPYAAVPKFPAQPVDLAFLVDDAVLVADIDALCREANPKLVRTVELFEVYRGQGLPEGKKSLNFTVELGSDTRTLTAKDEEKFIGRVRDLAGQRGYELRG